MAQTLEKTTVPKLGELLQEHQEVVTLGRELVRARGRKPNLNLGQSTGVRRHLSDSMSTGVRPTRCSGRQVGCTSLDVQRR
jgi:hypothetical protein